MKFVRSRSIAAAVVTAAMTASVIGGSVGSAFAAYNPSSPPYPVDPNNAGTVTIYDATTGAIVTSGSSTTPLNNYYFVANTDVSPGKTKATLTGFLAESGKAPGAFSGQSLSAATTYPVTAAPAPVNGKTTPVAKGGSSSSFSTMSTNYPNTAASTSDFYQLYQLRVNTTFPAPASQTYDYVDVKIDPTASTWTQVSPNPAAAPVAPGKPTATAGNGTASVTVPAVAGATSYTVTASPGGAVQTGAGPTFPFSGLTNGTPYTFTATATNANGTSAASAASDPVTPVAPTVPSAPTVGTATAGNSSASLTFTPSASNGGAAITKYVVTSTPSGGTGSGTTSPIAITGLTNGTSYTFTVHAVNSVGNSPESAASNAVTPKAVPSAPAAVSATAGNASASVAFTASTSDGGSAITGYTVTSSPGGFTGTGTSSPITVTGLTNGTAYTFTVKATNAAGDSLASAPSSAVTPATVPGAPTIGAVTKGNMSASVAFTAPASNGGSAITGYTVTAMPGGITATGTTSPITVPGLTNGVAYTFTVHATNAKGNSAESPASSAVTPAAATVPGAPTGVSAAPFDREADVSFTAPASNGGATITGYTVTSNPGGITATGTTSPVTVSGLTNDVAYTFTVHATNPVGNSPESAASAPVTPSKSVTSVPTYRAGRTFVIRTGVTGHEQTFSLAFGTTGDLPLWGDWNGDGNQSPGVYRPSNRTFYLTNDDARTLYKTVVLGAFNDRPISGDFNGDGTDSVGVYRPSTSTFFVTNNDITVVRSTHYGTSGDKPLVGDWNGSGFSQLGVFRPSTANFYLRGLGTFHYGRSGDAPVVGDWDGDGVTNIGVVRGTTWYVSKPSNVGSEAPFAFGVSGASYLSLVF
jgi:hypothetical protein